MEQGLPLFWNAFVSPCISHRQSSAFSAPFQIPKKPGDYSLLLLVCVSRRDGSPTKGWQMLVNNWE